MHTLSAPPQDDLVYFAMVDRFANGDPDNDEEVDLADPAAFHGGDLAGLRQHLDDLEALGVRTLWLSPIAQMRTDKIDGYGAFHGYWTRDPGTLEPRFGSPRDLRRLSRALHRRGMRLVLDMVWNHVGYDAPLTQTRPDWFHGEGDIVDWADPLERTRRDVHGLPDLALEREDVYQWQLAHARGWLASAQPDGFRIDAVRHMPITVQARFTEDLRASAGPEFWTVGEVFEGDAAALDAALEGTGYSAVFDFPLYYAMIDTICKDRPAGRLASTLSQDRLYGEALREHPGALLTFLDNHDLPRLTSACGGDLGRATQALGFLFMSRGTPVITWGTESATPGDGEPANRADLDWAGPMPLAEPLRQLAALRAAHRSLRSSSTTIVGLDGGLQLLRLDPDELAVVSLNRGQQAQALPAIPGAHRDGGLLIDAAGALSPAPETVPPGGLMVAFYLPDQPGGFGAQVETAWAQSRRPVVFQVDGLDPAMSWRLVGSDPALGQWQPGQGLRLDAQGRARCLLPAGAVLAAKLVGEDAAGEQRWERGEDRYFLVQRDGPDVLVRLEPES